MGRLFPGFGLFASSKPEAPGFPKLVNGIYLPSFDPEFYSAGVFASPTVRIAVETADPSRGSSSGLGRRGTCVFLAGILAVGLGLTGRATEPAAATFTAHQIEAVYLYNFTEFVEWPAQSFLRPDSPLTIGILGSDPFGPLLDGLVSGATINGRPIVIRRFVRPKEIESCNILFIGRSEADRVEHICSLLKGRHILTVSEINDFVHRGGIVELVEENQHVRFRIDFQHARAESLTVSAKLLRAAEVVSAPRPSDREVANTPVRQSNGPVIFSRTK